MQRRTWTLVFSQCILSRFFPFIFFQVDRNPLRTGILHCTLLHSQSPSTRSYVILCLLTSPVLSCDTLPFSPSSSSWYFWVSSYPSVLGKRVLMAGPSHYSGVQHWQAPPIHTVKSNLQKRSFHQSSSVMLVLWLRQWLGCWELNGTITEVCHVGPSRQYSTLQIKENALANMALHPCLLSLFQCGKHIWC